MLYGGKGLNQSRWFQKKASVGHNVPKRASSHKLECSQVIQS